MSKRYECWIVEMDLTNSGEWRPYDGGLLTGAWLTEREAVDAINKLAPASWYWLRVRKYVEAA